MSGSDKRTLVVQDPGGPFAAAFRQAFYDPFERETGIHIIQRHNYESTAMQREMIATGNYAWDVAVMGLGMNLALRGAGICDLEPLELGAGLANQYASGHCDDYFAGDHVYANILAYRLDAFPDGREPKSWRDFWNLSDFPGRRSLRSYPIDTMEEALLADGVKASELYPLDVPRALAALTRISSHVHWWMAGDEQAPLLSDNKVDMCAISNLRAVQARNLGAPVGICWNQNIRTLYGWEILRGNPRVEIAREFIRFAVDAKRQAERSKYVAISPVLPAAAQYLTAERLQDLPDAHLDQAIECDAAYWSRERPAMVERFDTWLACAPTSSVRSSR